ncbi:GyrI-like domain-containing protein [Paenibacillus tarimensis]
MESKIIQKPEMTLVGLAANVTLKEIQEEKTTYKLGSTFMGRRSEIMECSNSKEVFGVSTDPEKYDPDMNAFEFFVGVKVPSLHQIPEGMVVRKIPANTYVQFTFKGTADKAGSIHNYLYSTWLKQSEYELCDRYNIEVYDDERNQGPESEESITDLCFPIRKKATM